MRYWDYESTKLKKKRKIDLVVLNKKFVANICVWFSKFIYWQIENFHLNDIDGYRLKNKKSIFFKGRCVQNKVSMTTKYVLIRKKIL